MSVVVFGCSSRKNEAIAYAKSHALGLLRSSQSLRSHPQGLLPEPEYPAEIRPLNPSMVAITEHGLAIYINSSPVHMTGIFIRHDPKFVPPAPVPDSDEMGYEPVSTDIFWFSRPR